MPRTPPRTSKGRDYGPGEYERWRVEGGAVPVGAGMSRLPGLRFFPVAFFSLEPRAFLIPSASIHGLRMCHTRASNGASS
jgi:hypothetical protein